MYAILSDTTWYN